MFLYYISNYVNLGTMKKTAERVEEMQQQSNLQNIFHV
jgi:hypothetical protein